MMTIKCVWSQIAPVDLCVVNTEIFSQLGYESLGIFPTLRKKSFCFSLTAGWRIIHNGVQSGVLLQRSIDKSCKHLGDSEIIVAVWKNQRRKGIARWMIGNIPEDIGKCFAVVSNRNKIANKLFCNSSTWHKCDSDSLFNHTLFNYHSSAKSTSSTL